MNIRQRFALGIRLVAAVGFGVGATIARADDPPKAPAAKPKPAPTAPTPPRPTPSLDDELLKKLDTGGGAAPKAMLEPDPTKPAPEAAAKPDVKKSKSELVWLDSLPAALASSAKTNRPVLVKFDSSYCAWCVKLDEELVKAEVVRRLKGFVLVRLDVERDQEEARRLNATGTPALRMLTPLGRLAASNDGYLPAEPLIAWLDGAAKEIAAMPEADLVSTSTPGVLEVIRIVGVFKQRDARLREAALARLRPYPKESAVAVVQAFADGSLQSRLSAWELLNAWNAPVAKLDPWLTETFGKPERAALDEWSKKLSAAENPAAWIPTPEELAAAERELEPLLSGTIAEAAVVRERLAKFGPALIPAVVARLRASDDDSARERLSALRYRLAASPRRALEWPGGIERLASRDAEERRRAADELVKLARPEDQALFLELFGDEDGLVREIGLRGLRSAAGDGANAALVKLLDDPEPNVRAAVLKQWVESPSPTLLPRLAKYVVEEKDLDLLVHAVHVLREIPEGSRPILLKLLKHEAWQVRAEAAEGVAKSIGNRSHSSFNGGPDPEQVAAYTALIELIDDRDTFVVSKALEGLRNATLPAAVKPMIAAMKRAPELAPAIVEILSNNSAFLDAALPTLRELTKHADPAIRAKAIQGLTHAAGVDCKVEVLACLSDPDTIVRTAAARGVWTQAQRNAQTKQMEDRMKRQMVAQGAPPGLLSRMASSLFGGNSAEPSAKKPDDPKENKTPDPKVDPVVVALRKSLKSTEQDEQAAAALALAGLGFGDEVFDVIVGAIEKQSDRVESFAEVLPSVDWAMRERMFTKFLAIAPKHAERICSHFVQTYDDRASDVLWRLFENESVPRENLLGCVESLTRSYLSENQYSPENAEPVVKQRMRSAVHRRLARGNTLERVAALAIYARFDVNGAWTAAVDVLNADVRLDPFLRGMAIRVALLLNPREQWEQLAVGALRSNDPDYRIPALAHLCETSSVLRELDGNSELFYFSWRDSTAERASSSNPFSPKIPKLLTSADLQRVVDARDPKAVPYVAYLKIMLGTGEDYRPLLEYWEAEPKDQERRRLLTRALAYLDDPASIPLLERIWATIDKDDSSDLADFYWTVRIMNGEAILALRKRCREEVGMDKLR